MVAVRLAKISLTLAAGLFCLLVGYNNIVDYGSNFMFVEHVLSMDTTFPDNAVRHTRALIEPTLHHMAYWLIIAAELIIGGVCVGGAVLMLQKLKAPARSFNEAKATAIVGLAAGLGFWFFAFIVVGGEWFMMWQSEIWNGQASAFRFIGSIGLILLFVTHEDTDISDPRNSG